MEFAERTKGMKASEIRELLKLTEREDIISFGGGMPSPHSFPVKAIGKLVKKILKEHGAQALQYGMTEGLTALREVLAERMNKVGIACTKDNILITSGSQQALDLIAKIFLNPNDAVAVESPSYLGALTAFNAYQPSYVSARMDKQGMVVEELEEKLDQVKFIYTVPTFQNPTGISMSLERRQQLLALAEKHGIPIVEDNAYCELRYSGKAVPSIKSMDKKGLVIHLCTFSKILAPGFRLGFVVADQEIIKKLVMAKQGADLCTNVLSQHIANEYLRSGLIDKQIPKIRRMYKKKRNIMLKALKNHFPKGVSWTKPEGGMFIWIELPKYFDTEDTQNMFDTAIKEGVAFVHGAAFFVEPGHKNTMRLNFSNTDDGKIEEGIKRLAKIIKDRMR